MFMVYWTTFDGSAPSPHAQAFEADAMVQALALMEALRARQRAGEPVRFVTMSSENPDVIGNPGVDVTGPGYRWTKRRQRW
ncbi:MAG: hypothetical protein V4723_09745 [Pseudomonadota bacterium]